MGAKILIGILLALLALAVVVAYAGITTLEADVPAWAYAVFAFGALITLVVGGGLMWLVFYSARQGYDEPPQLEDQSQRRVERHPGT
jgi:hypothetical protein